MCLDYLVRSFLELIQYQTTTCRTRVAFPSTSLGTRPSKSPSLPIRAMQPEYSVACCKSFARHYASDNLGLDLFERSLSSRISPSDGAQHS